MARIFITGSADGLGLLTAKALVNLDHYVVLHARNAQRGEQALKKVMGAENVLVADLSSIQATKGLAAKANALGAFDVVIHNAGVYQVAGNSLSAEGLPVLFVVNSLAPYILTCSMLRPKRLIYLSSGMHLQGNSNLDNIPIGIHNRNRPVTYPDTKLHNIILALAVARKWSGVYSNAVDPGWVPTKMGGASAPDSLEKGFQTQVWLADGNDPQATSSGCYFHHKQPDYYLPAAGDVTVQDKFIALCKHVTGVEFNER